MTRNRIRLAFAGLLAVVLCLLGGGVAHADGQATLSTLTKSADGTVNGVLTVQPIKNTPSVVDTKTLKLSVDGKEYPATAQSASSVERAAILLIDRSGSMKETGMTTVRSSVTQFLQSVPQDVKVGVVSFGDQPNLDLAPTLDHNAVQAAVNGLKSDGATALYDGLSMAVDTLGTAGDRSILLLSDGKDTISKVKAPTAEQKLKASGIRAQVIAFRTNFTDNLALGYLAAAGQGSVTPVENSKGVSDAFTAAAKALDTQASWSARPQGVFGKKDVTLRGIANGTAFAATSTVDFGEAPSSPSGTGTATAAPVPGPAVNVPPGEAAAAPPDTSLLGGLSTRTVLGLPMPVAIAALLLFVGLLLLVTALLSPAFKSKRRERVESIEQYVAQTSRRAVESVRTTNVSGIAEQLIQLGDRVVEGRESTPWTVQLLQRADLPWRAGEWAVLRVISVVVGMLLGILLLHSDGLIALLGALLGIVVGVVVPPVFLRLLAGRRARKFERQLPDVLTLVASSLSTGFSLPQALDAVSHDVAQPAAKEFSRAMAETRIGSDIEEALERLAERMDSKNMRWTAMAIGIQRKVGGNLAETLRTTATTLREREALFRHVRALSAEGRLSGVILIALPIVIFLWMLYVNAEYISLLWQSLLGIAMCFVAVILMIIGVIWMRKVVEVEV
ncbi:MAG: type II secretion system F family protein [Lapillicoccus sp.]